MSSGIAVTLSTVKGFPVICVVGVLTFSKIWPHPGLHISLGCLSFILSSKCLWDKDGL